MKKQNLIVRLEKIVRKNNGYLRLDLPVQFTLWCAGQNTDVVFHAIVDMAKSKAENEIGQTITDTQLYAIAEDYTAWNVEDFFNEAQLETIINRFGRTVEIEYRMKVQLNGFDMEDIANKFDKLQLSDKSQGTKFVEMIGVWDAKTCEEVTDEFNEVY